MTIEIVDLPIENGGSFHSYLYVYQRVHDVDHGYDRPAKKPLRLRPTWFLPVVSQGNLPWRNLPGELIVIPRCSMYGIFTYKTG